MIETLTTYQIADRLLNDDNANWTRSGALALAEYLEELEDGCGEQMEFCRVAIRCEYSEYESLLTWAEDYGCDTGEDNENTEEFIRDYITERGQLIEFDGGIIVSSF